jgi:4-hydroxy-tetrahydrodipicolinate reductase
VTRLAILGAGKMGQLLATLAPEAGFTLVAHLDKSHTTKGVTREALNGAEVVIEFTEPASAAKLVRDCVTLGVPVVSGTTGWDAERVEIAREVQFTSGALLWAPNFALGVHLFSRIVSEAARRLINPQAGFTASLVETHHTKKLDAPSGTAKMLAEVAAAASGQQVPITSVRVGEVPGTHEVIFDAAFEEVRLVHEARDRRVFASGALTAAKWLVGKRGVFTLDDLFGEATK